MWKFKALVTCFILLAGGCSKSISLAPNLTEEPVNNTVDRKAYVDIELPEVPEGIIADSQTAKLLAYVYYQERYGLCGAVKFKAETQETWEFSTMIGFSAEKGDLIIVNKKDGSVTHKDSPKMERIRGHLWRYFGRGSVEPNHIMKG